MTTLERIGHAAMLWQSWRVKAKSLFDERNAMPCDHQEQYAKEQMPAFIEFGGTYEVPRSCFKDYCVTDPDGEDQPRTRPVEQWCASCQHRATIHISYRAATKARGIANRRVQLLCRVEQKRETTT